mgnify:CR=1 FL=1
MKSNGSVAPNSETISAAFVDELFAKFLEVLNEGEGVSTFEFMESGVTSALCNFLVGGYYATKTATKKEGGTELHDEAQKKLM